MSAGGEGDVTTLEFTLTWVVEAVCTVIVAFSLAAERLLYFTGKYLKNNNQKPLYEALQKVKEELMLLGFISLLLTVFQARIVKICVSPSTMQHLLQCSLSAHGAPEVRFHHKRLFAKEGAGAGYCAANIHQWKRWEDSIAKDNYDTQHVLKNKVTNVHQHEFIRKRFSCLGKHSFILSWFQFNGSVTKSDYGALRLGFIMTHCRGNLKFNFFKYMICALEDEFKVAVGGNMQLLIAIGTRLEHVISQLAHESAE